MDRGPTEHGGNSLGQPSLRTVTSTVGQKRLPQRYWRCKLPCLHHKEQHDTEDRASNTGDQLGAALFLSQERPAQQ